MKPVICFYENDSYFYSENYTRLEVPMTALPQIQTEYFKALKIVQTNFEGTQATVFILNDFNIIDKMQLASDKKFSFEFQSNVDQENFVEKVLSIKKDIQSGRYYQVNLTSSFSTSIDTALDSLDMFKYYFSRFQSSYCAFLPLAEHEILCFSPELFLEKKDSSLKTCPIKGTVSKEQTFNSLLKDEKENAELSMIVDLLRNDLQSVCDNKVEVVQHRAALSLNYVTHTYSEIAGVTSLQLPEILSCMLPAGSISGCPKKESVLAIHELEPTSRGFYTGCIGWWKENDSKLNLAIRSFLREKNQLTYFSGCGIVYDSDPQNEWREFNQKAHHVRHS